MVASPLTVEQLPGVRGAERINRLGLELFISTEIGEDLLAAAYLMMKHDGLLETVFYESVPPLWLFLSWATNPNSKFIGCFVRPTLDVDAVEMAGLGWLWQMGGVPGAMKAETGMVFLKKWQHSGIPVELAEKMLDCSFGPLGRDVLYGVTPVRNRAALLFSRKLGFKQTEPLPKYGSWHGEPTDIVMSYLEKGTWLEKKGV